MASFALVSILLRMEWLGHRICICRFSQFYQTISRVLVPSGPDRVHTCPVLFLLLLLVLDTVRGPSPALGPALRSSPDASPGLHWNSSFTP